MSTHNIPFLNVNRKIVLKLSQNCNYGICSKGPKNEFETAVVNEPSVFEPSKFHCTCDYFYNLEVKKRVVDCISCFFIRLCRTGMEPINCL